MEKGVSQVLIMAVFHDVETSVPSDPGASGVFIVGKDSGTFFFKWAQYQEASRPVSPIPKPGSLPEKRPQVGYNHQIYLTPQKIQKILVTPTPNYTDIIIFTLDPPETLQFSFKSSPMESALQFLQILAVDSALMGQNTCPTDEFWRSTSANNANMYPSFATLPRIYDLPCEDGKFTVPFIHVTTSIDTVPLVDELTKVQIAAQFNINGDQYENSPWSLETFEGVVDSSVTFADVRTQVARRGLSPELRSLLWPMFLEVIPFSKNTKRHVEIRTKEYLLLKQQWQTLSSLQLNRRTDLRSAYQTIRMDVRRTNLPPKIDEKKTREVMTDVLKTYAVFHYDVRYTQGLNDILLPFVLVIYNNESEHSDIEKEALCFWCFASFVERIQSSLVEKSMDGVMQEDLPNVLKLIQDHDDRVYRWIVDCKMDDMNFIVSSFMLAFRRSLTQPALERAWDTIMTASQPHLFVQCLAASLMIFAFPAFARIENCATPHILPVIDKIFAQQPIGAVVGVALHIADSLPPVPPRRGFSKGVGTATDFFEPEMLREFDALDASHLFV